MRFNPPPNWPPFPPDWRPGPDWQPDPSWPPPPPGWALWVDDQQRYAPTDPGPQHRSGARKWWIIGGVDAAFTNDGRAVRLDPHDAVDTPKPAWAGLIQPGDPACSLRFTGRVRSATGGYALGLTAVTSPADTDSGPIPTPHDNDWHAFDVTITKTGVVSVDLDGKSAVRRTLAPGCGRPAIRVSAGATEFADVLVGQVAP